MFTKTATAQAPSLSATAPTSPCVTEEDQRLGPLYAELLDRLSAKQPWERIAEELLKADPANARNEALACFESYKQRALWMRDEGCRQLLEDQTPEEAFKIWAAEILVKMIKARDIGYCDARSAETWAENAINDLMQSGKLQPNPTMAQKDCARILQDLLTTKQ